MRVRKTVSGIWLRIVRVFAATLVVAAFAAAAFALAAALAAACAAQVFMLTAPLNFRT